MSLATVAIIASFLLAQVPFSLAEWRAMASAPDSDGLYDLVIEAAYGNLTAGFPLKLQVNSTSAPSLDLSIEPVYPLAHAPPIDLRYKIQVIGSDDFDLSYSNLTIYYASEQMALSSGAIGLAKEEESGYWHAVVDLPLKGEYKAAVYVEAEKGGRMYKGTITTVFTSDTPSPNMLFGRYLDKRVLLTSETFTVSAQMVFGGMLISGLQDVSANLFGTVKGLAWDPASSSYSTEFSAPDKEGIYPISIYSDSQGFGSTEHIFVVDPGREKSGRCPLAYAELGGCADMRDARRCIYDYKAGIVQVAEEDLAQCIVDATRGLKYGALSCAEDAKGDLDGDGRLDADDLGIIQTFIMPLVGTERSQYNKCADYDLDGDVDEDDVTCLSNVISTKWYGDLKGGICFDAAYDTPLKCDLNEDGFIGLDDEDMLQELIDAASAGISTPEGVLDACDMNQDGMLTAKDKTCVNYFGGMNLDEPETLLAKDQTIPEECMEIYTLKKCQGIRGDVNGDGRIDQADELLEMLVYQEQITGYDMDCADVNKDQIITVEDVLCVLAYTKGDKDYYFICIGCGEYTPPEYRYTIEICNDQYDNNCDGPIDRTDVDGVDYCKCSDKTPCSYIWDNDGGQVPGVGDGNVNVCRKTSWEPEESGSGGGEEGGAEGGEGYTATTGTGEESDYRWMSGTEMGCTAEKECGTIECAGATKWKCAFDGTDWKWYANPSEMAEESSDPLDAPKLCDDGYDNDCKCGDQKCDEAETKSMFENPYFWVGLVAGIAFSFIPGLNMLIIAAIALAITVANMFIKDPDVNAALSGFSIGMSLGQSAQGLANLASGAGKSAASGVKDAAFEGAKTTAKNTVETAGKEAAKESVKATADEVAKKTVEEAAKETLKETGKELSGQALKEAGTAATQGATRGAMVGTYGTVLGNAAYFLGTTAGLMTTATVGLTVANMALGAAGGGGGYAENALEWEQAAVCEEA